jgi:hypothetical protein
LPSASPRTGSAMAGRPGSIPLSRGSTPFAPSLSYASFFHVCVHGDVTEWVPDSLPFVPRGHASGMTPLIGSRQTNLQPLDPIVFSHFLFVFLLTPPAADPYSRSVPPVGNTDHDGDCVGRDRRLRLAANVAARPGRFRHQASLGALLTPACGDRAHTGPGTSPEPDRSDYLSTGSG